VAHEKSQLISHLLPQGWCAFGSGVSQHLKAEKIPNISIDMDRAEGEIVAWQLEGQTLQLTTEQESAAMSLALPARHWAANMALTATIVLKYFADRPHLAMPQLQDIADILSSWKAVDGRMATLTGSNGMAILDDSYNANPVSMQAALDTLSALSGRRTAIIGDMGELENAAEAHASLDVSGVDRVILVGPEMAALKSKQPEAQWFATTDEALNWVRENMAIFGSDDHLLIKASRSMKLDCIVRLLVGKEAVHAL